MAMKNVSKMTKKFVTVTLVSSILIGNMATVSYGDVRKDMVAGDISFKYEVGSKDGGGFISSGKGDAGGKSYGLSQFTSKGGGASANSFRSWVVKKYPKFASCFEGADIAGTPSFDRAWKSAYNLDKEGFSNAQKEYTMANYVNPFIQKAKNEFGIDFGANLALEELAYSTTVQFGVEGAMTLIRKSGINSKMDDKTLVSRYYQEKRNSVGTYKFLGCDKAVQRSVFNRFINEEKDILGLLDLIQNDLVAQEAYVPKTVEEIVQDIDITNVKHDYTEVVEIKTEDMLEFVDLDDIKDDYKNVVIIEPENPVDEADINSTQKDDEVDVEVDDDKDGKDEPPTEDTKVEDTKIEDVKVEDTKVENNSSNNNSSQETTTVEDTKVENNKVEDTKLENNKSEDVKVENNSSEDANKTEDIKSESNNIEESKPQNNELENSNVQTPLEDNEKQTETQQNEGTETIDKVEDKIEIVVEKEPTVDEVVKSVEYSDVKDELESSVVVQIKEDNSQPSNETKEDGLFDKIKNAITQNLED